MKFIQDKLYDDSGKQHSTEAAEATEAETPVEVPAAVAAVETEPAACTEQRQAAGEDAWVSTLLLVWMCVCCLFCSRILGLRSWIYRSRIL